MKMFSLNNMVRKQPFMKKVMRNRMRNNNGVMWLSLLSIGVSALIMGARKGKNINTLRTLVKRFTPGSNAPSFNNAVTTEFSEELLPNVLENGKRNNQ